MEKIKNICRDLGKAFTIGLLSGGAAAAVLLLGGFLFGGFTFRAALEAAKDGLLLIAALLLPASAALPEGYAEQRADSGADGLPQRLPADVRERTLQLVGDPLSPEGYTALSFSAVLRTVADLFGQSAGGPFSAALSLLGVTAVCAMLGGAEEGSTLPGVRQTYHTVSGAAACGLLLVPFMQLLRTVADAVESAEVFLLSFVPVYGALLSVGGSAAGALSYQTTLLSAAQLLGAFCAARWRWAAWAR